MSEFTTDQTLQLEEEQNQQQMSHLIDTQSETLEDPQSETLEDQPEDQSRDLQEWETIARAWLSTVPRTNGTLQPSEVESWLESNQSSLPEHVQSMPRNELYEHLNSLWNDTSHSNKENDPFKSYPLHARFKRTDHWMPVYSWLESLDTNELISSKDVLDWMNENPEVRDDLYSRHNRYHLMHYIKKCHMKILKRKERKTGIPVNINTTSYPRTHRNVETKPRVSLPSAAAASNVSNISTDGETYMTRRNEALQKFNILVEMKKELSSLFLEHELANILEEPAK